MQLSRKISGQNFIVTGAARGIGLAIALAFADEGANVAICGRDKVALAAAKSEINARAYRF